MGRRMRGDSLSTTNKPLVIFATLFVVLGVVGIAVVSSLRFGPSVHIPAATSTSTARAAQEKVLNTPLLVLVSDHAATFMLGDGTAQRLSPEDFSSHLKTAGVKGVDGSSAATGGASVFGAENVGAPTGTTRLSMLSPKGTYLAVLGAAQNDGAGVVTISRSGEEPQKIVLRDGRMALKDAAILGWFSDHELMLAVTATSSRALYSVSTATSPHFVATLPDNLAYLAGREGDVWYVTATPGEGLESPPRGPSAIHRVHLNGSDIVVTSDQLHVVTGLVPDQTTHNDRLAYTTDDGQAFVFTVHDGHRVALGKVRPLIFIQSGELIIREGYDLSRLTVESGASVKLGPLPEGGVNVFDAARVLSATSN